jgi:hypothetical protein
MELPYDDPRRASIVIGLRLIILNAAQLRAAFFRFSSLYPFLVFKELNRGIIGGRSPKAE